MILLDGKVVSEKRIEKTKEDVRALNEKNHFLKLAVVLVGNNEASLSFIKKKKELAARVGIDFELFHFDDDIPENTLIENIHFINQQKDITGLIVQLPLPRGLNKRKVLDAVDPKKDVDCLTSRNLGFLAAGNAFFYPPTAAAVLEIMEEYEIDVVGKHVVVIGKGDLVGKPLGILLMQESATISVCNRQTPDLSHFTKQADIIIGAAGVGHLVTAKMVKDNVIIIDAGTSFIDGKLVGDVKFDEVAQKASFITPVPGGVGPVNVAKLLENCVTLHANQIATVDQM